MSIFSGIRLFSLRDNCLSHPTASFEMPTENLKVVYQNVENEVRYIDLPKDI